jgi:hypothetical protein
MDDGSSDDDGMGGSSSLAASGYPNGNINGIAGMKSQPKNIGAQVMARHPVYPGDKGGEMPASHASALHQVIDPRP